MHRDQTSPPPSPPIHYDDDGATESTTTDKYVELVTGRAAMQRNIVVRTTCPVSEYLPSRAMCKADVRLNVKKKFYFFHFSLLYHARDCIYLCIMFILIFQKRKRFNNVCYGIPTYTRMWCKYL